MWHGRTKRLSARKNFAFHARIRMLQRHDVKITNEDLAKMEAMLRNGRETVLISRSGCSVKAAVPYRDRVFPVIYDERRRQIVTFLKEEFLTPTQKERFDMCHPHIDLPHTVFKNPVIPEDMVLPVFEEEQEEEEKTAPAVMVEEPLREDDDRPEELDPAEVMAAWFGGAMK